ncbi:MAG: hypothetical protein ABII93_01365 [Chrysiogenia bacterium]
MKIMSRLRRWRELYSQFSRFQDLYEEMKMLVAKPLVEQVRAKHRIDALEEVEFKVFSQWGDDGIIQWLVNHLPIPDKTFIEFGVDDYREANTRFLLMNDNWSGLIMDRSEKRIREIRSSDIFWKHDLSARAVFLDRSNVDGSIASTFQGEIGLLHIDIDGNDYWLWQEIKAVQPIIVIIEYNSVFGSQRPITIPYQEQFDRPSAHSSCLYYGASIPAFCHLAGQKGYAFIGCNVAGNNAYFVRRDKLNDAVREVSVAKGFRLSKFRDSRDAAGRMNYLAGEKRADAIRGMPVFNVVTERMEKF